MTQASKKTSTATLEYPQSSPDDLARRLVERRAVEAVIWGMPAVNTDLMRQEMLTKTKGRVNQILYWSRPLDWKNQTLTPNPDSIYFMAFFDTKDAGPVVLEVPRADGGSIAGNRRFTERPIDGSCLTCIKSVSARSLQNRAVEGRGALWKEARGKRWQK